MLICVLYLKTASAFDTEEMRIEGIHDMICEYEDLVCDRKKAGKTSKQQEKQQNTQTWSESVLFCFSIGFKGPGRNSRHGFNDFNHLHTLLLT